MIKSILKFWISWIVGAIIAVLVISLWKNEEVDWGYIITLSIVGLIGGTIGKGLRKFLKKNEN